MSSPETADATPGPAPFPRRSPQSPTRIAAIASAALHAAGRLFVPKCPRCGARRPTTDAACSGERDTTLRVRCRACHHEWFVIPQDPLLGP